MPKLQIVCYEKGWILEEIAKKWQSQISMSLPDISVSLEFGKPVEGNDIYIHVNYSFAIPVQNARNIVYVTHLNTHIKLLKILLLARSGAEFICMSTQTRELLNKLSFNNQKHLVVPESLHFNTQARERKHCLTLGMFFRIYSDGRKSNENIRELAQIVADRNILLILFGSGFAQLLKDYSHANVIIVDQEFKIEDYIKYLDMCDYVVYFGSDEGAISVLDSAARGIPVIATNQGFHQNIDLPKYSVLDKDPANLIRTIKQLSTPRRREDGKDIISVVKYNSLPNNIRSVPLFVFQAIKILFIRNPFLSSSVLRNTYDLLNFICRIVIQKIRSSL
jgi:glycosyltransferase involved in cell wall biosynthesis